MTDEIKIVSLDLAPKVCEEFVKLEAGLQFCATVYHGTDLAYAKCMVDGFHIIMLDEILLPFAGTEFHVRVLKVEIESAYNNLNKEVVIMIKGEIV